MCENIQPLTALYRYVPAFSSVTVTVTGTGTVTVKVGVAVTVTVTVTVADLESLPERGELGCPCGRRGLEEIRNKGVF